MAREMMGELIDQAARDAGFPELRKLRQTGGNAFKETILLFLCQRDLENLLFISCI